jgi:DNA polymerase elongation subunit (family B)
MDRVQAFRPERLLALDIETVPDRERLPSDWGTKFPKPIHHAIACISFVEAEIAIDPDGCERTTVTACRSGGEADWDEKRLLQQFWRFFAGTPTRIVGWNTRGFDVPVLLQRSLVHGISAEAWFRSGSRFDGYSYRYADTWHADLMDVLSDYGACARLTLDEAAAALGFAGKIGGHGSEVEAMMAAGNIEIIRRYCECDALNTYCLYLRHGLLTGRMRRADHDAALDDLVGYLDRERGGRPHFGEFLTGWKSVASEAGMMQIADPSLRVDAAASSAHS